MDEPQAGPIVDRAALESQTFGDAELMAEVIGMFREQAPALLAAIEGAQGAARAEVAHRLKGSALALAAGPLAAAAGRLEAAPDDPALRAEVRRLADETLRALAALVP